MDKINYYQSASPEIQLIDADYQDFAFQPHYHLDYHLGLICQGEQSFRHKGSQHRVGSGQMVIMPPDVLHDGEGADRQGYQVKVFSITPEWFETHYGTLPDFRQLVIDDPALFGQFKQLHQQLVSQQTCQLAQDCLPLESFDLMMERYAKSKPEKVTPLGSNSIETLKAYLLENLDQPVRLEELAGLCQLSATQFQRRFKAAMGMPPYAWLSRLRMEQALNLLLQGKSGTDVAMAVGFYDQAHFTKAFKACYGITPSQVSA